MVDKTEPIRILLAQKEAKIPLPAISDCMHRVLTVDMMMRTSGGGTSGIVRLEVGRVLRPFC